MVTAWVLIIFATTGVATAEFWGEKACNEAERLIKERNYVLTICVPKGSLPIR